MPHAHVKPFMIQCLEASTGHITKQDNELLKKNNLATPVVYHYEFGCFIYVGEDESSALKDEGFSEEFITLLKLARKNCCKFLQLDGDGTEYDDLPKFNW